MTELSDERQQLADLLRGLREERGMSTTQLAGELGWSQSKVSKTERGATLPAPPDVEAWAIRTGAPPELRSRLMDLAEQANLTFAERRRVLAPGRRRVQEEIRDLEATASVVRVYSPNVIVGLAQTATYVRAMFGMGRKTPPEHLNASVRGRLDRQRSLADRATRFELLMGEAAVRRRVVSPSAMQEQLEHLSDLSRRPNVTVGVIRFDATETVHQHHGYSIMGDPDLDATAMAWATTVTRTLRVRDELEVREYLGHFRALQAAATTGDELRRFLSDLASPR